jgi:hypothetical protein
MSTSSLDEAPRQSLQGSWPLKLFANPRHFDRNAENQPYVEWLKGYYWEGEECFGDDDDSEESEEEEERKGFDLPSEGEDDIYEEIFQDPKCANGFEGCDQKSVARRFMEGLLGDEDCLSYPDQVEVVAGFCDQALASEVDTEGPDTERKVVILLDDRTNGGRRPMTQGQCRPKFGSLTTKQLREELSKPVRFKIIFRYLSSY